MTHRDKPVLLLCEDCQRLLPADPPPEECPNCGSRLLVGLVKQWKVGGSA